MTIEIFDAFNRMSFLNINRITKFLHEHLEDCKDPKMLLANLYYMLQKKYLA